jgi:hypothetical protein
VPKLRRFGDFLIGRKYVYNTFRGDRKGGFYTDEQNHEKNGGSLDILEKIPNKYSTNQLKESFFGIYVTPKRSSLFLVMSLNVFISTDLF